MIPSSDSTVLPASPPRARRSGRDAALPIVLLTELALGVVLGVTTPWSSAPASTAGSSAVTRVDTPVTSTVVTSTPVTKTAVTSPLTAAPVVPTARPTAVPSAVPSPKASGDSRNPFAPVG